MTWEIPGRGRAFFKKFLMTLIAGWASLDNKPKKKEISAIYLLSDSRISWSDQQNWNNARKIFCFSNHPDIIGYCGDVLFPTQVISQIITLGDAGLLFVKSDGGETKSNKIFTAIQKLFENYPTSKPYPSFSIIHCGKEIDGDFYGNILRWKIDEGWNKKPEKINFPDSSGIFCMEGSGAPEFRSLIDNHFKIGIPITSSNIFQSFIQTLKNTKLASVGGPPQLAGIYRGSFAKTFGIIFDHKRYVLGLEFDDAEDYGELEWRNELFERSNPITKKIADGAKKQFITK